MTETAFSYEETLQHTNPLLRNLFTINWSTIPPISHIIFTSLREAEKHVAHNADRDMALALQLQMQEEENHPFFKTMLLNILKEQDYTQAVEVRKFSQVSSWIPAHLPNLKEYPFFKKGWDLAEQKLAQRNPSLLEIVHSLLERHSFLLYPFELEQDGATIAAAYHALAEQYMTGQDFCERAALIYEAEEQVVKECLDYIKEIEGISYPII